MDLFVEQEYRVHGMSCAACAHSVESILRSEPGVVSVDVNYGTLSAIIAFRSAQTSTSALRTSVQSFGYDIVPQLREHEEENEKLEAKRMRSLRFRAVIGVVLAIPLMVSGMEMSDSAASLWTQCLLSLMILLVSGREFFIRAISQARHGDVSMDTLVALSTSLAFGWSVIVMLAPGMLHSYGIHSHVFFESSGVIIAAVLIGKVIEESAKIRARSMSMNAARLLPSFVQIVNDDVMKETPLDDVRSGDLVRVLAGQRVPVDGVVRDGSGWCDEAILSGESAPVAKTIGDAVYAGTLNRDGVIIVEARSVGEDTMVRSIERAVRAAQSTNVPAQRFVDAVSSVFVPAILLIAALTMAGWLFVGGFAVFPLALSSSIAVLIVACPCALGLAAPIALVVGIQRAASRGILVKDAQALETASKVTDVVFDKTGTLSDNDDVEVVMHWLVHDEDRPRYASLLHALESASRHPYAQALVKHLDEAYAIEQLKPDHVREITGGGVEGVWSEHRLRVGSEAFVRDSFYGDSREESAVQSYDGDANDAPGLDGDDEGFTFAFSCDGERICNVEIRAALTAEVPRMIGRLHAMKVRVHMVSGDSKQAVIRSAGQAGITSMVWRATPRQKEEYVRKLRERGAVVAMVGDGMNDAQSLAVADVSIAVGRGSDTAVAASKIVLTQSEISRVADTLYLARRTMSILRQNIVWAFAYNIILIPIATGALASSLGLQLDTMYAGMAMGLSSVSVVSNSLRLSRVRIPY